MRMTILLLLALTSTFLPAGVPADDSTEQAEGELWPEIEPFERGYLRVSDIHEIYYELCGNPEGKPVFMLHGGPGGMCSPVMRRFCDPEKFLIVLHDQRGAGRSRPYLELRENTTWHLVGDIERLRKKLDLDKIILFGGSWGATLGLAYAEKHPDNVSGLVLRGVFTATTSEIDHFYHGGVRKFFPEMYESFIASFPDSSRRPLPGYLFNLITSTTGDERKKYIDAWARYEIKISVLEISDRAVDSILVEYANAAAFSLLENHYMANNCFLEEGQLLENAGVLEGTPVVIVNGRYDVITPPVTAYRLHRRLPGSRLVIAERSGHWMGEENIRAALIRAMRGFE